jgi:hypothetical protein
VKLNPFEEIKPESEKWIKNYIYQIDHELKVGIIGNRTEHFNKKNVKIVKFSFQSRALKRKYLMLESLIPKTPSISVLLTEFETLINKLVNI